MKKDLEYIAKHVTEWPDDKVETVRLDYDGEICFTPRAREWPDFYPEGYHDQRGSPSHPAFVADNNCRNVGVERTRAEWKEARVRVQGQEMADTIQAFDATLQALDMGGPHYNEDLTTLSPFLAAMIYTHNHLQDGKVPSVAEVRLFLEGAAS